MQLGGGAAAARRAAGRAGRGRAARCTPCSTRVSSDSADGWPTALQLEEDPALGEHQVDVDARRGSSAPRRAPRWRAGRSRPRPEAPGALGVGGDPGAVQVGASACLSHRTGRRRLTPSGRRQRTTAAPSLSWPSRNTVALTGNGSPTTSPWPADDRRSTTGGPSCQGCVRPFPADHARWCEVPAQARVRRPGRDAGHVRTSVADRATSPATVPGVSQGPVAGGSGPNAQRGRLVEGGAPGADSGGLYAPNPPPLVNARTTRG